MSNSGIIGPRQTFTGTAAGGINTLTDAQVLKSGNLWPTAPDAPTSVSATTSGSGALAVAFTAPSYVGSSAITAYRVTASTGQTATGSSSPITVSGLTSGDTVTCTVAAQNAVGFGAESSASSGVLIPSAQNYTTSGTYLFTIPAGVSAVSIAAIGAGGGGYGNSSTAGSGGGGGAFAYVNNLSVTAGQQITVVLNQAGVGGINPTAGGAAIVEYGGVAVCRANGGGAASASSGGAGGTVQTGSGGAGGAGGPRGGNYGSGGNGGGGGGGAGGKTSAGGTGADAGQSNPPYNNATHGSASGGSGGFGGGTSGYTGGGVAFETTNIVQTSMYSQPNMPSVASTFHSGSPNHYGGGGGGAYHTGGAPKNGQGGAVQIKWGGATY